MQASLFITFLFFFNDTATTEIYTLSLHDALPILRASAGVTPAFPRSPADRDTAPAPSRARSEEHTSELQSQSNLVCRLLLEKKNSRKFTCRSHRRSSIAPCHPWRVP